MSDPHTFGLRLRRERERRGISLEAMATATKVGADLWEGLERNDLSRWPSGIFARAFIRDYARVLGVDPQELVDEFCRIHSIGDRRTNRLIKAQAELIGHQAVGLDEPNWLPAEGDRRSSATAKSEYLQYAPRIIAAAIDVGAVLTLAGTCVLLFDTPFWGSAGVMALLYHTVSTLFHASPGARVAAELRHRVPAVFAAPERRRASSLSIQH
jgi:transcriptional regulator with XRE-family HTH domain